MKSSAGIALLCMALSLGRLSAQEGTQPRENSPRLEAPDGRLIRADNAGQFRSGKKTVLWVLADGVLWLRSYDSEGRLESILSYGGTELLSEERNFWNGTVLEKSELRDFTSATLTRREFLPSGLIAAETGLRQERILYEEWYSYDDEGRLELRVRKEGGIVIRVEREYGGEGMLLSEKRLVDGIVTLLTVWTAEKEYQEEHYARGTLFARVFYSDGEKKREELFKDGVLVRERSF